MLAFTFSFDEFIVAWFVCGFSPTLPVSIYAYIVSSADPSLNAMAAIIFVMSLLLIPMLVQKKEPDEPADAATEQVPSG
ncbi:MAG: putative PotC, ABC-type spermidine/putrescine transport system, permease component PotC [Xanthobacteraceae bacterium]|nr:putative PotC, ABC-type spermidine/putrescine transport system, permease component PotC [Xanthobacteraceae bacterium]